MNTRMNHRRIPYKKKTRKKRIKMQLLVDSIIYMICMMNTALPIGAESDMTSAKYKCYTSYYVEAGDSLWSIALDHMSDEYVHPDAYIQEVKNINHIVGDQITQGTYITIPYYAAEDGNQQ